MNGDDNMHENKGFTLIEMLIVMAVLVILAALAYPNYRDSIVRTRRVEGETALIDTMQKEELFRARHHRYAAFSREEAPPPDAGIRPWSGQSAAASAYEIDGVACAGESIADCIQLRARPGTDRVDTRFRDPLCGALTLDSHGRQGAEGDELRCWP
jgi:type IV pilus assembly protein PilE